MECSAAKCCRHCCAVWRGKVAARRRVSEDVVRLGRLRRQLTQEFQADCSEQLRTVRTVCCSLKTDLM